MYVFSSLDAAIRSGFRWYAFSEPENLHVVELDRATSGGRRVKALAFARPSAEKAASFATSSFEQRAGAAA